MTQPPKSMELDTSIVIVEDDRRLLDAIEHTMQKMGARCMGFCNVDEAVSYLSVANVDVVITDLKMPGIDGSGLIGLIRENSNIPIIIITGNMKVGEAWAERRENISVFRKPFALRLLVDHVRAIVSQFRLLQQDS